MAFNKDKGKQDRYRKIKNTGPQVCEPVDVQQQEFVPLVSSKK